MAVLTFRQVRVVNDGGIPFNVTLEDGKVTFHDATPRPTDVFGGHGKAVASYFEDTVREFTGEVDLDGREEYRMSRENIEEVQQFLFR